jgi:hypothetical protein
LRIPGYFGDFLRILYNSSEFMTIPELPRIPRNSGDFHGILEHFPRNPENSGEI